MAKLPNPEMNNRQRKPTVHLLFQGKLRHPAFLQQSAEDGDWDTMAVQPGR
jgi:hypothetical protein